MQNEAAEKGKKKIHQSLPAFENDFFVLLLFEPSDQSFNNHLFSMHEKEQWKRKVEGRNERWGASKE